MNLDNSANLFNINISIIKNNNDKSNIENLNEKEDMDSKEEFFKGEKISICFQILVHFVYAKYCIYNFLNI